MTDNDQFLTKAKTAAARVLNGGNNLILTGPDYEGAVKPDDLAIVWFAKVLRNWKALVTTTKPDGIYFEVTYNGTTGETYVDWYEKSTNMVLLDSVFDAPLPHLPRINL